MPEKPRAGQSTIATIMYPPGVYRTSTPAGLASMPPGNAGKWFDAHLIRWVRGRLRPILGWERVGLGDEYTWTDGTAASFASPLRAMHQWSDLAGTILSAFLCEKHLYVLEGNVFTDITPTGGIQAPPLDVGGFGDTDYGKGDYGTERPAQPERKEIGEVWRLRNWGEDLLAMASSDGRLLRWSPSKRPPEVASVVPNAPVANRTFEVTSERHVLLFSMGGAPNKFGWCSMENIEDWDFLSTTNTAGFYEIEPLSKIINAVVSRYVILFWTVQGAYSISYKGLPYIYTYEYVGTSSAPISGMVPVVYAGNVVWPAQDGFWIFNGNSVGPLPCTLLDWWQEVRDNRQTRRHMASTYNGAQSELWFFFPIKGASENTHVMIYNFDEGWWSKAQISRSCGFPGNITNYPFMGSIRRLYRHEFGNTYSDLPADPDAPTLPLLPYIVTGAINLEEGSQLMTTRQILIDSDADLDAVEVQLYAAKGRNAEAPVRTKGAKRPRTQGRVDYRLTGRDFVLRLKSSALLKPWSFGQGKLLLGARGRRGAG